MFFIGPSANIFVYLLVSVFFVICFYSKSEAMLPESLPGYESIVEVRTGTQTIYFSDYQVAKEFVSEEKKEQTFLPGSERSRLKIPLYFREYNDPYLLLPSLRAPPVA